MIMNAENVRLESNIRATAVDTMTDIMESRQRGFASDYEAWAEVRALLEAAGNRQKNMEKLHKEMWDHVKRGERDAVSIMLAELESSAVAQAGQYVKAAALCKIAQEL